MRKERTHALLPAKRKNGANSTIACNVLNLGLPVQSPHSSALCAHSKYFHGRVSRSCAVMLHNGDSMGDSSELTERQRVMAKQASQSGSISACRPSDRSKQNASYSAKKVGL